MNKCKLCGTKTYRPKYCSAFCIKQAWYIRNLGDKKSSLVGNPEFWKTETGIGLKWEKYLANKIDGTHLKFNKNGIDVTKDGINYDVKVCEKYKQHKDGQWVFNRNKKKDIIDFYYCICLEGGKIVKELKIPVSHFVSCGITIGRKSHYDEFVV